MISAGLGRVFNVVASASGVHIPMRDCAAVSFVTFVATGDNTATIKQSIDGNSETALDVDVYPFKSPGIGGTWTAMAEQDDTITNADATNDSFCFTVLASSLADGYNCVEVTVDAGTCVAILHDLLVQRYPANLRTNVDV